MFAWNNSVLPSHDVTKSPTAIRVKTPPTVEMIDPQNEDADKTDEKNEDVQAEKKQKTSDSSEDLTNPEKTDSNAEETKAETETKLEPEIPVYDNPLLVNVRMPFLTKLYSFPLGEND